MPTRTRPPERTPKTTDTTSPTASVGPAPMGTGAHGRDGTGEVIGLVVLVRSRWASEDEFTPATLDKCGETIARFARRLHAQGVTRPERRSRPAHCQGFVDAATRTGQPPELTTRHARRTALRMLFRTLRELGYDVGDPSLDLRLPARSDTTARPLTDLEVTLCRASPRGWGRPAAGRCTGRCAGRWGRPPR